MSKIAVLFAGQGAQKPGMGRDLLAGSSAARAMMGRLKAVLPEVETMCTDMPGEELNLTKNTQPAVFATDLMAYAAFSEAGFPVAAMAGFSLGEYAALCAADVLTAEAAMDLVVRRAVWMQECADEHPGNMVALLGADEQTIQGIIHSIHTDHLLTPVNYNCPGQTVIAVAAGVTDDLLRACKERRVRAIKLAVSGAFHCRYMERAASQISDYLAPLHLNQPSVPLYANATAEPYEELTMKDVLASQTMRPVLFSKTIEAMLASGIDTFVEVGPGSTLSGFVKRMSSSAAIHHICDCATLTETLAALKKEA